MNRIQCKDEHIIAFITASTAVSMHYILSFFVENLTLFALP